MCLVPLMMLLMMHQPHLHQPWRLDRCNPFIHSFIGRPHLALTAAGRRRWIHAFPAAMLLSRGACRIVQARWRSRVWRKVAIIRPVCAQARRAVHQLACGHAVQNKLLRI